MFINFHMIPSVVIWALLFIAGAGLGNKNKSRITRILLTGIFLLACLPAFSFIGYYLSLWGESLWYIRFRSINHIELLSASWGLLFGFLAARINKSDKKLILVSFIAAGLLLTLAPYLKPVIRPVYLAGSLEDKQADGVILQSTGATCGPSSLATIFKYYGEEKAEEEIARATYSCATGTENWYLIRYARKNGYAVEIMYLDNLEEVPVPSILGVYLGRIGHFITFLGTSNNKYIIGDSLVGRLLLTEEQFYERYKFGGFVMHIKPNR